tara:strand:+ start:4257 stop:5648 length:1392 start_codon:yes stop_codon:yes gene_type:complete
MMKLTAKQETFVTAARDTFPGQSVFTRADIQSIVDTTGAPWPRWLTDDDSRRIGRGQYSLPEVAGSSHAPAPAAPAPVAPSAPVASAVKTVAAEPVTVSGDTVFAAMQGTETLVPLKDRDFVPFGYFKDLDSIIRSNMFYPVFITGLSGNGKTTMVEQVCARQKREYFRVNITCQTDEDDLLGGFRLVDGETVWQDGPVIAAMKRGGVLLLDEIDLGRHAIMCLQPVLEGKGVFLKKINQFVKPAAGFTVIATGNTKGKGSEDGRFAGTNILNEAFLDRFPVTVEQDYPSVSIEKKIITKKMNSLGTVDADFAENLVKWSDIIRKSFHQGAVDELITTRRLINACTAFHIFGDRVKAVEMAVARFDDDTKESFMNLYTKVDADAGQTVEEAAEEANEAALESCDRVDLSTSFDEKDEVKAMGAKWDKNTKKWHITGDEYRADRAKWAKWSPTPVVADETVCPF